MILSCFILINKFTVQRYSQMWKCSKNLRINLFQAIFEHTGFFFICSEALIFAPFFSLRTIEENFDLTWLESFSNDGYLDRELVAYPQEPLSMRESSSVVKEQRTRSAYFCSQRTAHAHVARNVWRNGLIFMEEKMTINVSFARSVQGESSLELKARIGRSITTVS